MQDYRCRLHNVRHVRFLQSMLSLEFTSSRVRFGPVCTLLLAFATALVISTTSASAQNIRAEETGYIRARLGLSGYGGDRTSATGTKSGAATEPGLVFGAVGAELGYQFTPAWSIGLSLARGTYPKAAPSFEEETGRFHSEILARWMLLPSQPVSPYLTVGGHVVTGGPLDNTGYGPVAGLGIDLVVSDRVSLFLEGQSDITLPDEAADDISAQTGADFLHFLGGGLKVTFGTPFTPARIRAMETPDTLRTGQEGTFRASVNRDATTPITNQWHFGDGNSGTGLTVQHGYEEPGSYSVRFTTNNRQSVSQTRSVEVLAPPEIVTINATPSTPEVGQAVSIEANVRGSQPITHEWNLGDGTTTSDQSPDTYIYDSPGSYTLSLQVSNPVGTDQASISLNVEEAYDPCEQLTSLNTVHFGFDESDLSTQAQNRLDENVNALGKCPDTNLRIDAYTDHVGSDQYNLRLSERRARSVADYYQEQGITQTRIQTRGLGKAPQSCEKEDPGPGCRKNRRAESIPLQ